MWAAVFVCCLILHVYFSFRSEAVCSWARACPRTFLHLPLPSFPFSAQVRVALSTAGGCVVCTKQPQTFQFCVHCCSSFSFLKQKHIVNVRDKKGVLCIYSVGWVEMEDEDESVLIMGRWFPKTCGWLIIWGPSDWVQIIEFSDALLCAMQNSCVIQTKWLWLP